LVSANNLDLSWYHMPNLIVVLHPSLPSSSCGLCLKGA
jgi:hypothetical protein